MRKQNKKSKKQNIEINYLDLIPVRSEELHWHKDIKGRVILDVENTGWFNKIAQTVFNKPQYTKVHLDAQGTFIWPLIDGKRTVTDIAALVKEEFGEPNLCIRESSNISRLLRAIILLNLQICLLNRAH